MPSKTPALCCLLLLICVGLSASIQASTEAKPTDESPLVMTACTIDKPIAPITGTEEQPGLLRNILDATARDTGIAFKYRYLPWL
ncbi:MAG: hypothetical protein VXZ35_10910, partial [Pseudomonadota bacterium]|nr:hypothetical protein [Pseudomonadota bacterium]